ncbi:RNA polymerase sigma factor SigI [Paenibacillus thailandensis]|uniref:RNA polymerase sigma factor SigI n=1 Tax=Paenibacillus thailandensis TaxID=393250 RepID=A0ABW5QX18_9BACL
MLFKRFFRKASADPATEPAKDDSPEQQVLCIAQGDEQLREHFIYSYKPFILKTASRFCKKYVNPEKDDEFSIALMAFNEAINQYSPSAGKSFLGFAETVIRRRLIDYVRKEQRHAVVSAYSAYEQEDEERQLYNPLEVKRALQHYDFARVADERRMEIGEFNEELRSYGITFAELVECSPKHADSRRMLMDIARTLAEDEKLMRALQTKGKLPVKELTDACGVSRKTIERNRKYIIALCCVMTGAYPYLRDYLKVGGGKDEEREEIEC